jgi:hypothetical protein
VTDPASVRWNVGPRIVLAAAIIASSMFCGFLVRRLVGTYFARKHAIEFLRIGSSLPEAAVIDSLGRGVGMYSILDSSKTTVFIIATVGCQACIGEGFRWADLAKRESRLASFRIIVCSDDFDAVRSFVNAAQLPPPAWLCDPTLRTALKIFESPTIYAIAPRSRQVSFASRGDGATEALETYFQNREAGIIR